MIDYATYQRVQHLHRVEQLTLSQIAVAVSLDVRTVRRWLDEPRFRPRVPCARPSKLDPFKGYIRRLLEHHPYSAAQILIRRPCSPPCSRRCMKPPPSLPQATGAQRREARPTGLASGCCLLWPFRCSPTIQEARPRRMRYRIRWGGLAPQQDGFSNGCGRKLLSACTVGSAVGRPDRSSFAVHTITPPCGPRRTNASPTASGTPRDACR